MPTAFALLKGRHSLRVVGIVRSCGISWIVLARVRPLLVHPVHEGIQRLPALISDNPSRRFKGLSIACGQHGGHMLDTMWIENGDETRDHGIVDFCFIAIDFETASHSHDLGRNNRVVIGDVGVVDNAPGEFQPLQIQAPDFLSLDGLQCFQQPGDSRFHIA